MKPSIWRQILVVLLTSVAVLSNYPFSVAESRLVAFLCLILLPFAVPASNTRTRIIALLTSSIVFLSLMWAGVIGIAFSFLVAFLVLVTLDSEIDPRYLTMEMFCLLGFSLFVTVDQSGILWQETTRLSQRISEQFVFKGGKTELLDFFELGLAGHVYCFLVLCSRLVFKQFRWELFLRYTAGFASLSLVFLVFQQIYLSILLPTLLASLDVLGGEWKTKAAPQRRRWRWAGIGMVSLAMVCLFVMTSRTHLKPLQNGGSLVVLDGGLKTVELPQGYKFIEIREAKFGSFLERMKVQGWSVDIAPHDELKSRFESSPDLVMVVNPNQEFSEETVVAATRYVESGGRLIVLGDHTDIGGTMGPLNQLLGMSSIRFKFDSAIPNRPDSKWTRCLRGSYHPSFYGGTNKDFAISIGASLECKGDARVLVQGVRCFSDYGRPDYGESRLGDMQYNFGEERGGLALVAEQRIGKGAVQVWGDTSGFQDGPVISNSDFLTRNLASFVASLPSRVPRLPIAALTLLLALVGFALCHDHRVIALAGALPAVLMVLVAIQAPRLAPSSTLVDAEPGEPTMRIAMLDTSHASRYPNGSNDKNLFRLGETFIRNDRLLKFGDVFKDGSQADTWVLLAPTKKYTEKEAERILKFIQEGGDLVLFAGHECSEALNPLLEKLQVTFDASPFGSAHNARLAVPRWRDLIVGVQEPVETASENPLVEIRVKDAAYDAHISFKESYPINFQGNTKNEWQPLATCWDRTIAARRDLGKGSVAIIADSRFPLDENLQTGNNHNSQVRIENAKFILFILEKNP